MLPLRGENKSVGGQTLWNKVLNSEPLQQIFRLFYSLKSRKDNVENCLIIVSYVIRNGTNVLYFIFKTGLHSACKLLNRQFGTSGKSGLVSQMFLKIGDFRLERAQKHQCMSVYRTIMYTLKKQ